VGFEGAVEERRGEACGAGGTGRDGVVQWTLMETLVLLAQGTKGEKKHETNAVPQEIVKRDGKSVPRMWGKSAL